VVLVASASIAGPDRAIDVFLGAAVLLLFTGALLHAVTSRCGPGAARSPFHAGRSALWRRMHRRATARPGFGSADGRSARAAGNARPARPPAPAPGVAPSARARPRSPDDSTARSADTTVSSSKDATPESELPRLRSATIAPLGGVLERSRRLREAEERVARELIRLPDGLWLVERYVLVGPRRTGVFVICASDGAWTLHDLDALSRLAHKVHQQLPSYDGTVHAAVCLAFDAMTPRTWFGGEEQRGRGGWVLGVDRVQQWIVSFGPEHGLPAGDIRRLDEASGPIWDRRSTARLPLHQEAVA
jgi:hypothetical protein